jgi:hypothetical protein
MSDPRTRVLTIDELEQIAARLVVASRGFRNRPRLQSDLVLAARLIAMLIRAGVINKSVDLEGGAS